MERGRRPGHCRSRTGAQRGLRKHFQSGPAMFSQNISIPFPRGEKNEHLRLENTWGRDSKAAAMCFAVRTCFFKERDAQVGASGANLAEGQRGSHLAEFHLLGVDFGSPCPSRAVAHSREAAQDRQHGRPLERSRTPLRCPLSNLPETPII